MQDFQRSILLNSFTHIRRLRQKDKGMADYYKPRTRTELVRWLERQYPCSAFRGRSNEQLWAIFYSTIRKHEQGASNVREAKEA